MSTPKPPAAPSAQAPGRVHGMATQARSIVIVVTALMAFRSSVADWNDVPTQSMEPTILVGDRIAVNKLAYDLKVPFTTWHLAEWSDPRAGDVVVFYEPRSDVRMVKRVVGAPGDTIAMRGNQLVVNGVVVPTQRGLAPPVNPADLSDPPPHRFGRETIGGVPHHVMGQPSRRARRTIAATTVPAGHYFLMGDNRDNSRDSRFFSFVPRDTIVGRAYGTALSFDRSRHYAPRWERFFRGFD